MKYRYIFEKWGEVRGTNDLQNQHLLNARDHRCDYLIDLQNATYYDAENNEWKPIEGDNE